ANQLVQVLARGARSVRIVAPPSEHKDLRAWLVAGATREQLQERIDGAKLVQPHESEHECEGELSAIATTGQALEPGSLSRRPPPRDYLLRWPTRDGQPSPPREGDGFAPTGVCGFLSAEGGVGKTTLLLVLGVAVVTGRDWLGFQVDRSH